MTLVDLDAPPPAASPQSLSPVLYAEDTILRSSTLPGGEGGATDGNSSSIAGSAYHHRIPGALNVTGAVGATASGGGGVRHGRRMSTGAVSDMLKPQTFKARFLRSPSARTPSSGRMAMDITGLRKAMLIRIWGMDMGPGLGFNRKPLEAPSKVSFFRRRASFGDDHAVLVIWVLDVESGVEWKCRKTVADFLALKEECQGLAPGLVSDFPLRKSTRTEGPGPLTKEKMDKLELFLRKMGWLMDLSPSPATYQLAKILQDFVGATERVDILTEMQHRSDRDVQQMVQIYGCDVLRRNPAIEKRLSAFITGIEGCDVAKTEVLKSFNAFVGSVAQDMLLQYGDVLRGIVNQVKRGSSSMSADDVDILCVSCLRRVIEAEIFVPLMPRVYEKVKMLTDGTLDEALAGKLSVLSAISISSWESPVQILRRIGDNTTLPSDKLDVLVASVKETHALFAREHPRAKALGGDDFLPIFIYIVTQAAVPSLLGLKTLMEELCDPQRLLSEAGYCLATLDAALNYLVSLDEFAEEP